MAMASWRLPVAWLHAISDAFPSSVPVQFRSMELPATTVGEWWRRHSLSLKTQGRNMDRSLST